MLHSLFVSLAYDSNVFTLKTIKRLENLKWEYRAGKKKKKFRTWQLFPLHNIYTYIPAICPGHKLLYWAWTHRKGSSPSTLIWWYLLPPQAAPPLPPFPWWWSQLEIKETVRRHNHRFHSLVLTWAQKVCESSKFYMSPQSNLLTIIQLVGLDNFHSIVWDAAAFNLLRQSQKTFEIHMFPIYPAISHYHWSNHTN